MSYDNKGKANGNYKHGLSKSPSFAVWAGMRKRCLNPNDQAYKNYGGRGIKICVRWSKFENFLKDMGPRPSSKYSLERVNNNKGYTPSNCIWATSLDQLRNTRRVKLSMEKVRQIKELRKRKWTNFRIADKFEVHVTTIERVFAGTRWA